MIDYRLVYELSNKSDFSIFSEIFSSLIFYIFMFILWKIVMNGAFKKLGIALSLIYLLFTLDTLVKKSSTPDIEHYKVLEGEVSDWVKAYNRSRGSFVLDGVKFDTGVHGIERMFNTPLHFSNGRRVKIHYIKKHKIVKFWIENYRFILDQACRENNYTACFELSRKYQEENRTKAQKLILKSTESNISNYSLVVSMLYKHGILFEKNETKAENFYEKASSKDMINWRRRKVTIPLEIPILKESKSDAVDILDVMD